MTVSIHKDEILYEITEMIKDREGQFGHMVRSGQMTKEVARKRYNAMQRAKAIVIQYYKRVEEDMQLTDELNKPEILASMVNQNPAVVNLVNQLKLNVE